MDKSQPISLTFICQTLGMGGAEVVNTDLLHALQSETNCTVSAYANYPPFIKLLQAANISTKKTAVVIDIIGNWKGLVKALVLWPFALAQYAWIVWQNRKTDVIFMTGFIEKIFVTPLAVLLSVPVVWMEYAPMNAVAAKFYGVPFFFYQLVSQLPKFIIVPTAYTQRYFIGELKYRADKVVVLPCARYGVKIEKPSQGDSSTIVCVSRMEKGKGQDILVKAFALVLQKVPSAKLILVGEGEFEEEIKAEVSSQHISHAVKFTGRVEDSIAVMKKAAICVFPSVWSLEGFGMVTIEAMSLGKPIVAFNRGPSPEILEDGQTGLLANPGDIKDLAQKILRLLNDKILAAQLGANAQQAFQEKYIFEKIVGKYLAVFQKAAHE